MGCPGGCNKGSVNVTTRSIASKVKPVGDCEYTKELVEVWKTKMVCIVNNNYFSKVGITHPKMNKFLGVINTIVVYDNNPCSYVATLDKIRDLIIKTVDLGICQ